MAKKSKSQVRRQKNKRNKNQDQISSAKQELAGLIDELRDKKRTEVKEPKEEKQIALSKEFESIFSKFELSNPEVSHIGSPLHEQKTESQVYHSEDEEIAKEPPSVSKKRQRKLAKPSLSYLKSMATYPQVVQWYDCDAPDPTLLVMIKSHKNIVPVPGHWQLKREYLSGRSLLSKKPFELPDIIRQTDIEEMRNTLPGKNDDENNPSLKEISRARVQPKMNTLDIDYKKLHDAFFKLGARWKPDFMLPYGDLFYENRNLNEEENWHNLLKNIRPGNISDKLREAMGLPEGKLPPWCAKMKDFGLPPGYPNLRIAGLNWGIENLNGNVYGSLKQTASGKKHGELFGEKVFFEEEQESESESENEGSSENRIEGDSEVEEKANAENHFEELKLQELITKDLPVENPVDHKEDDVPKQLYTVLKEKQVGDQSEFSGSRTVYEIPSKSKRKATNDENGDLDSSSNLVSNKKQKAVTNQPKDHSSENESKKFKF